jgi:hypothetical protein
MSSTISRALLLLVTIGTAAGGCAGGSGSGPKSGTGGTSTAGAAGTTGHGGSTAGTTAAGGSTSRGGPTGTAGTTGAAGTMTDGGVVPAGDLGKGCATNSDCGGGLTCAAPDGTTFGGAGPAHGVCTKSCADADAGDVCGPLNGLCVDMSTTSTPLPFCMPNCTFGDADRSTKCRGRDDMACASVNDNAGGTVSFCIPLCGSDTDCPTGRHCDVSSGYCTPSPKTGSPTGTACMAPADGGVDSCKGFCLGIGSGGTTVTARFCSQACVLGSANACNIAAGTTSLAPAGSHAGCVLSVSGAQLGDLGYCTQECDTVTDCLDKTDPNGMCDTSFTSGTTIAPHGFCTW